MFKKHEKRYKISETRAKNLINKEIGWYYLKLSIGSRIDLILNNADEFTKEDILDVVSEMKEIAETVFYENSTLFNKSES